MAKPRDTVFKEVVPRESLKNHIDAMWHCEATAKHILNISPTTRSTLMTCATPYGNGIVLVGPLSIACPVEMHKGEVKVGAWLKPGSRYAFQPLEPFDLRDKVVNCRDMPLNLLREFEAIIVNAPSVRDKLERLQDLLELLIQMNMISRHDLVDSFIDNTKLAYYDLPVATAVRDIPRSYRHFSRLIKHYTGFTAKEFMRSQLLQEATYALDKPGHQRITKVAVRYNYSDHAHFTREYKSRFGFTPSQSGDHQIL